MQKMKRGSVGEVDEMIDDRFDGSELFDLSSSSINAIRLSGDATVLICASNCTNPLKVTEAILQSNRGRDAREWIHCQIKNRRGGLRLNGQICALSTPQLPPAACLHPCMPLHPPASPMHLQGLR